MGQTNNNTPFLHVGLFAAGFFFFLICPFLLSLSYKGVMWKLILVLCLSGIAVLAKPSRLQAKTAVRQMDDENCETNYKRKIENEMLWYRTFKKTGLPIEKIGDHEKNYEFACKNGVGYYCEREEKVGLWVGYCLRTCRSEDKGRFSGKDIGYTWIHLQNDDRKSFMACNTDEDCIQPNAKTYTPCKA